MKEVALKALEMDSLIEKYRISSAKHGRATSEGKPGATNREFDTLVALRKELRSRGEEGWQRLRSLRASGPGTRYWAATFLLEFAPQRGTAQAREIQERQAASASNSSRSSKRTAPWEAVGAELVGPGGRTLRVSPPWQAEPISFSTEDRRVVIEAEATEAETRGTFTLKLWDASGTRSIVLTGWRFRRLPLFANEWTTYCRGWGHV